MRLRKKFCAAATLTLCLSLPVKTRHIDSDLSAYAGADSSAGRGVTALAAYPAADKWGLYGMDLGNVPKDRLQNIIADYYSMVRVKNTKDLAHLAEIGYLVPLEADAETYFVRGYDIPPKYRYLEPDAKDFVEEFSQNYFTDIRNKAKISSATRTVGRQIGIRNTEFREFAALAWGDRATVHTTGRAVDISKRVMSKKGVKWSRNYLRNEEEKGRIILIDEPGNVFHVFVLPQRSGFQTMSASNFYSAPRK